IGTGMVLILFYGGNAIFHFSIAEGAASATGIALCHSAFNIFTTFLLLPFSKQLVAMAKKLIPVEDRSAEIAFLDPLLLRTPGVAVSECVNITNQMGRLARENFELALSQFDEYSEERAQTIVDNEDKLDVYEDHLSGYLVTISQHGTSMTDIRTVSRLLHAIGDFERIGDHTLNLQESAQELHEKGLHFSPAARAELDVLVRIIRDILDASLDAFLSDDAVSAGRVEPLEETIDCLIDEVRSRHVRRLQNGQCTVQLGFILNDLLTNFERVSDHCSNIAVSVIEEHDNRLGVHAYLHDIKGGADFTAQVQENLGRYALPKE
ncbi:MAG: Na/Pi cotransporter family protein, partial [Oscillibacter sp.]|nr:Na/Pi cotransporter family protein [Oscillibacter sp.]